MTEILIPESGDFAAWKKESGNCVAVDWDGTCKDTQVPKWTKCFNRALTEIWPALKPYQQEVDEICFKVNLVEESAGVQRFVALTIMMDRWKKMGLPVPDISKFAAAVAMVDKKGDKHGVATYRKLQSEYGYNDDPIRWSDLADIYISEASRLAKVFDHCPEVLSAICRQCDLVVVSASKTEAVRQDLVEDKMAHLFKALLAQDFLPKLGTLEGLVQRYQRTLFVGDMEYDRTVARKAGADFFLIQVGDEAASWSRAVTSLPRYLAGEAGVPGIEYAKR